MPALVFGGGGLGAFARDAMLPWTPSRSVATLWANKPLGGVMTAKILVIDDEPAVATMITRMLRGYDTSAETDPRRAVDRISHGERFDLILCDLNMPEMNGREVYEAVQRECRDHPPLMLIMSGEGSVEPIYAAGCGVLFKPFQEAELERLVSSILHEDPDVASAPAR